MFRGTSLTYVTGIIWSCTFSKHHAERNLATNELGTAHLEGARCTLQFERPAGLATERRRTGYAAMKSLEGIAATGGVPSLCER
jgi:hypothetical protein